MFIYDIQYAKKMKDFEYFCQDCVPTSVKIVQHS